MLRETLSSYGIERSGKTLGYESLDFRVSYVKITAISTRPCPFLISCIRDLVEVSSDGSLLDICS